jgi:hypothetical protein
MMMYLPMPAKWFLVSQLKSKHPFQENSYQPSKSHQNASSYYNLSQIPEIFGDGFSTDAG